MPLTGFSYLSNSQLAERLQVSTRTLAYWAQRGMVPGAVKIGRTWKFRVGDITEWLNGKHQEKGTSWQPYTSEKKANSTTQTSLSEESDGASQLMREIEEKLRKRQMRKNSDKMRSMNDNKNPRTGLSA